MTSSVTDMNSMFQGAILFNYAMVTSGAVWDTSKVTDMSNMFNSAGSFNQDISSWVVSAVANFNSMFNNACDSLQQRLHDDDVVDGRRRCERDQHVPRRDGVDRQIRLRPQRARSMVPRARGA